MYFTFDENRAIRVPAPFKRAMIPYLMPDTATCHVDFSVHLTELEPGAVVDEHVHADGMEAMFCLSGDAVATIGEREYAFTDNTLVAPEPGERHGIRNTGAGALRFLCIFSPPVTADFLRERARKSMEEYNRNQGK